MLALYAIFNVFYFFRFDLLIIRPLKFHACNQRGVFIWFWTSNVWTDFNVWTCFSDRSISMFILENFAKSLENFDVIYPVLARYEYPNFETFAWGDSKELPEKFFVKVRISGRREIIELKRNKNLINSDFNAEDFFNRKVVDTANDMKTRDCYFTGRILNQRKSLVALSTCHGLVRHRFSFWTFANLSSSACWFNWIFHPNLVYIALCSLPKMRLRPW